VRSIAERRWMLVEAVEMEARASWPVESAELCHLQARLILERHRRLQKSVLERVRAQVVCLDSVEKVARRCGGPMDRLNQCHLCGQWMRYLSCAVA
jgi:hypothetical protein